jgi:gluconolactonase
VRSEIVVRGITFGEGPVWRADADGGGDLVVTSVPLGMLYRVDVERSVATELADVDGGANGAALCWDGALIVTNNGGIDLSNLPGIGRSLPKRSATPGVQWVAADGSSVRYLLDHGFSGPNDLAVAPDGKVFFTDPGHFPPSGDGAGRVFALDVDGTVRLVADGFFYCNGIGFEPGFESLVVVERRGLMRVATDGSGTRDWLVEKLGARWRRRVLLRRRRTLLRRVDRRARHPRRRARRDDRRLLVDRW